MGSFRLWGEDKRKSGVGAKTSTPDLSLQVRKRELSSSADCKDR